MKGWRLESLKEGKNEELQRRGVDRKERGRTKGIQKGLERAGREACIGKERKVSGEM